MLRKIRAEIVVACIVATILFCVLMLTPVTGVADNGDFARIMNSTGLAHISSDYNDRFFGFANREYKLTGGIPMAGGYISSEIPLVWLAIFICRSVSNNGIFDIRFLSILYSVIFVIAFYLIIRSFRKMSALAYVSLSLLLIWVFTDIGYIAYFNSFYGEAVSLVFLLLMTGGALQLISGTAAKERPQMPALIAFYTGAAFFISAKVQNIPSGILVLLFGLRFISLRKDKPWRVVVVVSSIVILGAAFLTFATVSKDIKICNKYQSVFFGILKDSPDPVADLTELGLDTGYSVLAGTNYFMEEYPIDIRSQEFKEDIYDKVKYTTVAGFYLRHPDRFLLKLEVASANAFRLKQGMGNFEKAAGKGSGSTADYLDSWSDFKSDHLPNKLSFVMRFFSLCLLLLCIEYIRAVGNGTGFRRNKVNKKKESGALCTGNMLLIEYLMVLFMIAASQLVIPLIGDGEADLGKHLFLFNAAFDMLFVALSVYAVHCSTRAAIYLKICYNNRKQYE